MAAFHFRFMILAVNVIHRRGPNNEMRHQLQPKKTKVIKAVLAVYTAAKDDFTRPSLLTRRSALL